MYVLLKGIKVSAKIRSRKIDISQNHAKGSDKSDSDFYRKF